MANEFDVKSVSGNSMALNGQKGEGGQKPMASGKGDPGGTKPPRDSCPTVPMPK